MIKLLEFIDARFDELIELVLGIYEKLAYRRHRCMFGSIPKLRLNFSLLFTPPALAPR